MGIVIAGAWLVLAAQVPPPAPRVYDLYDWSATAPVVLVGTNLGADGKWQDFRIETLFRGGELAPGGEIRVALERANKDRDRSLHRFALKLDEGGSYLLLLEPSERGKGGAAPAFDLVRGLQGVREMPAEGRPAMLAAIEKLVEVQALASDPRAWARMGELLDESNPILLRTAMDQFLKFHRAEPEHLASLRPLLDHPQPELRERAARVIAQVLAEHEPASIPDAPLLRAELIARARRDGEVAVRLAATEALAGFTDEAVRGVLEEIAQSDPDQNVRYTAAKLVYERGQSHGGAGGPN